MAWTERYVSVAGGGLHDGTSEANAWTLAEGLTNAAGGHRVNVKAGTYSSVTWSPTNAGTGMSDTTGVLWRGYNSTIGDLEEQGRLLSGAGRLDTTNFPVITCTVEGTIQSNHIHRNLVFTTSSAIAITSSGVADHLVFIECQLSCTGSGANAQLFVADNFCTFIASDFICTGSTHDVMISVDLTAQAYGCRFETTAHFCAQVQGRSSFDSCVFIGLDATPSGSGNGGVQLDTVNGEFTLANCTFYLLEDPISTADSAPGDSKLYLFNLHITDCTNGIQGPSSAGDIAAFIYDIRTRDNGSDANIIEVVRGNAVTTDGGGPDTDYTEDDVSTPANVNLTLIDGAAGVAAGVGRRAQDIGGIQRTSVQTGGGGGLLAHPGMTGGVSA
jgi:hypothetical protein